MSSAGNSEAGFTVLELLVGLAIFAMMATAVTMTMPQLVGPPKRTALERAVGLVQQLRAEAVLTGRALVLKVSAGRIESGAVGKVEFGAAELQATVLGAFAAGGPQSLLILADGSMSQALVLTSGGERLVLGWEPATQGTSP